MNWIVSNWRLKLLALVLAVALLTAVAFSENPVTLRTVQARITWDGQQSGIVLVQPLKTLPVTLIGLGSAIKTVGDQSVVVRADVSKVGKEGTYTVPVYASVLVPNVTIQSVQSSLEVNADRQTKVDIPVTVQVHHLAPGLTLTSTSADCGNSSQTCTVSVIGPQKVIGSGLSAVVNIDDTITVTRTLPNEPIDLLLNGKPFDLFKTNGSNQPAPGIDPPNANVHVNVGRGIGSRPVALRPTVTGRPACGYAITGLTITPGNGIVTVSGPLDAIQNVSDSLPVAAVDVSNATGNVVVSQSIQTPSGVTADPAQVTITVGVSRQFDCTAPSPTPTPPGPSPTPTPR